MNLLSLGHAHPANAIDNALLAGLGMDAQWIESRIGIESRRTVLPLELLARCGAPDPAAARAHAIETPTDLGVRAAKMALDRAGLRASDIGLVLANCCTPFETVPSEAQRIACALQCPAVAYDVFGACPAFALHLTHLCDLRPERVPEHVLCISTAAFTTVVDYAASKADAAILGDGAAAWIVNPRQPGRLRILEAHYDTDASRSRAVVLPTDGHFQQDGRLVRSFSVRNTVENLRGLEARFSLDWERDRFIGHQANVVMLESVCRAAKVPAAAHWSSAREFGNQAGAGAPATLSMNLDALQPDQRVAVVVLGAGLAWGHVVMETT